MQSFDRAHSARTDSMHRGQEALLPEHTDALLSYTNQLIDMLGADEPEALRRHSNLPRRKPS